MQLFHSQAAREYTKIVYPKHNCILPVSTGVSGNLKDKSASASKASKSASSTTQKNKKCCEINNIQQKGEW